jgi:uncharacterized repeat protein (TIGR01451 family)
MNSMTQINKGASRDRILCAAVAFLAAYLLTAGNALAAGTIAGTTVTSTAYVSYNLGGAGSSMKSVTTSFMIDRTVNVVVTKNSDANTSPASGNAAASFLVSNMSNTTIRFSLAAVSKATNTWTMNNVRIYRDNNDSGTWDGGDTLYEDAGTFGDVATGASVTVLIVADTPSSTTIGEAGAYDLTATAVDAGTVHVSTQTSGPNTAGVDTVFLDVAGSAVGDGARDGKHSAAAIFTVTTAALKVNMNKTVAILDQWGGNQPIPGATLRYTIGVTATGGGTAVNIVISDPLPMNTSYVANSLRLNNTALTDAADTDAGDVGITTANTVTVKLGDLTSASPIQTITFDVKIQ